MWGRSGSMQRLARLQAAEVRARVVEANVGRDHALQRQAARVADALEGARTLPVRVEEVLDPRVRDALALGGWHVTAAFADDEGGYGRGTYPVTLIR
jgi:hypothetical protein